MQTAEEKELLEKIRLGDQKAFEAFFNDYWHLLFNFAEKLLGSYDDAQDVVQTVYIAIWERRADLVITGSPRHYLLQAVRYRSISRLRELLKRPASIERVQQTILPVLNDILSRIEEKELTLEIDEQIDRLPGRTKEIFLMSRQTHLSIREIADRLQLSEQTVKNQLHKAIKLLRHSIVSLLLAANLFDLFS